MRSRSMKGGIYCQNFDSAFSGKLCHRGIGGNVRKYVPSCVMDPDEEVKLARRNRTMIIGSCLSPKLEKELKKKERIRVMEFKKQRENEKFTKKFIRKQNPFSPNYIFEDNLNKFSF